jgi:hypothetical protein
VVDESFSEQEDSYCQDEPRKSEVVKCYYEVFVNNNINDDSEAEEEEKDQSGEEEKEEDE